VADHQMRSRSGNHKMLWSHQVAEVTLLVNEVEVSCVDAASGARQRQPLSGHDHAVLDVVRGHQLNPPRDEGRPVAPPPEAAIRHTVSPGRTTTPALPHRPGPAQVRSRSCAGAAGQGADGDDARQGDGADPSPSNSFRAMDLSMSNGLVRLSTQNRTHVDSSRPSATFVPPATRRPMDNVTTRQRRILEYISRPSGSADTHRTVREIGEAVGLTSSSSVHAQTGQPGAPGPAPPRRHQAPGEWSFGSRDHPA